MFYNKEYFQILKTHNIPYKEIKKGGISITSLVIPSVGVKYIKESILCATFASRYACDLKEIVIVTDQPEFKFFNLPPKTRVVTLSNILKNKSDLYLYKRIYFSRLIKIQAPLYAETDGVLLIDSDLNLLKMPNIILHDNNIYCVFRKCKLINKFSGLLKQYIPFYYQKSIRAKKKFHINSGFIAATRNTWKRLCPFWLLFYQDTWNYITNLIPMDQLPLLVTLDTLNFCSINLSLWMNWSIPKNIGGKLSVIPKEVIGAHGGIPLSEWNKYLYSSDTPLLFKSISYTSKIRYLTDTEENCIDFNKD